MYDAYTAKVRRMYGVCGGGVKSQKGQGRELRQKGQGSPKGMPMAKAEEKKIHLRPQGIPLEELQRKARQQAHFKIGSRVKAEGRRNESGAWWHVQIII